MKKAIKSKIVSMLVSGPEWARGVHGFHWLCEPGESTVGMQIRTNAAMMLTPKQRHQEKLAELRAMPKPVFEKMRRN